MGNGFGTRSRSNYMSPYNLNYNYLTRCTYGHAGFGRLITGHMTDNY